MSEEQQITEEVVLGYVKEARRYIRGDGVKQNKKEGVRWLTKAAEQGHAVGQRLLGGCYARGDGVKQDMKEAARWFTMAAEQGDAAAAYALSRMAAAEAAQQDTSAPPTPTPQQLPEGTRVEQQSRVRVVGRGGGGASSTADATQLNVAADEILADEAKKK